MLTWLWLLFLVAGTATVMVGAWRAGFWSERGIPKGRAPWGAVFAALGLFTIGQVFLIVDGALHGNAGQSIAAAVSFLLPAGIAVYAARISQKRTK